MPLLLPVLQCRQVLFEIIWTGQKAINLHSQSSRYYCELKVEDAANPGLYLGNPNAVRARDSCESNPGSELILRQSPLNPEETDSWTYGITESSWHLVPYWELDPAVVLQLIGSPWGTLQNCFTFVSSQESP